MTFSTLPVLICTFETDFPGLLFGVVSLHLLCSQSDLKLIIALAQPPEN